MTTIGKIWRAGRDRLAENRFGTAALDARLLAEHAFDLSGAHLIAHDTDIAPPTRAATFETLIERRLRGEPVARILGQKEFYGLQFALSPETLIPRPETELLVDLARDALSGIDAPRILDLGTGTGCIAIALLHNEPTAHACAVDLSEGATEVTRANGQRHKVDMRLHVLCGSWFEPLADAARFDLIVSNPPYIETDDIETLDTEVRSFDPHRALDGGRDGFVAYRAIVQGAGAHLEPGGTLLLECGAGQAHQLQSLLLASGFETTTIHNDLAGIGRVVTGRWPRRANA